VSDVRDFDWGEGRSAELLDPDLPSGSMTFNINGKVFATNPSVDEVREALESLPGGDEDSFVILGDGDQRYMQTTGCVVDGFHVEYRDGPDERHFMIQGKASFDETAAAFESYLSRDKAYIDDHRWVPMPPFATTDSSFALPVLFVVVLLVLAFGWYVEVSFADALTPRNFPLFIFGIAVGVVEWLSLTLAPIRISKQISFVGFAVVFGLLFAAQLVLGNPGVRLFGIAWAMGLLSTMLLMLGWKRARQAAER
jgi:hypothetical protein